MHTNAHIFKKLGFTTTIQEYFAEHYTIIQNDLEMTPKLTPSWINNIIKRTVWGLALESFDSFGIVLESPRFEGVPCDSPPWFRYSCNQTPKSQQIGKVKLVKLVSGSVVQRLS